MNKIIMASITAVVVIAVLAGTLIPILDDATATQDTFTNDGYYRMQKITADDTTVYTIAWDKATDTITLNGVEVDIGDHSQYTNDIGVSIVMTDQSVSRYVANARVQSWATSFGGSIGFNASTIKIVLNNGTETITENEGLDSEASRTVTYDYAYFASNTGDFIMKNKTKIAYVNSDSELCAVGVTGLNNETTPATPMLTVLRMTGDASSVEFNAIVGGTTATFDDIVITAPADTSHIDLYKLEKVTGTATYDGADTNLIYSYFAVPYEVTAERAVHFTDGENAIFNAIPVMVIIALLLGVVALVLRSRMD